MTLTRARLEVLAEVGDRLAIAEAMTVVQPGSTVEDYAYLDTDEEAQAELKSLLAMSRVDFDTAWKEGHTRTELSLFGPWRPTTREQIIALMKPEEAWLWRQDLARLEAAERLQQQRQAAESWSPAPLPEHEQLLKRLQAPKRTSLAERMTRWVDALLR